MNNIPDDPTVVQLNYELSEVRETARVLMAEIGWARGQFGSILASNFFTEQPTVIDPSILPKEGYDRMNSSIGNKLIRDQLYIVDEDSGNFSPR